MKTEEELCDFLGKDMNKIEKLCRICLSDDLSNAVLISKDTGKNMEDIESLEAKLILDQELSLREKIAVFGRVNVKYEDDLLKYICEQCCYDADVAYTFRVKCRKAENLLRNVLRTLTDTEFESNNQRQIVNESKDVKDLDFDIKEECADYASDHNADDNFNRNDSEDEDKKDDNILDGRILLEAEFVSEPSEKESINTKEYNCIECNRSFGIKSALTGHITRMHSAEKRKGEIITGRGAERRFHCTECDYKAKTRRALGYHMSTHTGARPYKCDVCEMTFTQQCTLSGHRKVHSDKTYFTCPECGKQFKHKKGYLIHCNSHSKEYPFKCDLCGKGLKTRKTLEHHMKRHMQIKDFSCETCGRCFVTKTDMMNHKRSHNKQYTFQCSLCSFVTYTKRRLKAHLLRHSGDRQYKCDLCDYTGYTLGAVTTHKIKHTKEAKYPCPVCDQKFRHSSSVNLHMMRKHGEKYKWNDTVDRRVIK